MREDKKPPRFVLKVTLDDADASRLHFRIDWSNETGHTGAAQSQVPVSDSRSIPFFKHVLEELNEYALFNRPDLDDPEFAKRLRHAMDTFDSEIDLCRHGDDLPPVYLDFAHIALSLADAFAQSSKLGTYGINYPRFWELLRFILGRKTREQVFEPAYNDLLADHLTTRGARFQTPWARRWIRFCFAFRTVVLVARCALVGIRGKAVAALLAWPVWGRIRDWWFRE